MSSSLSLGKVCAIASTALLMGGYVVYSVNADRRPDLRDAIIKNRFQLHIGHMIGNQHKLDIDQLLTCTNNGSFRNCLEKFCRDLFLFSLNVLDAVRSVLVQ